MQGAAFIKGLMSFSMLIDMEPELFTYRSQYPRYVITTDELIQKRNGIKHVNLMEFMKAEKDF